MRNDDLVFKALADPVRRLLLDALFNIDGQSASQLEAIVVAHTPMTRFGVAKHLRLLEEANLVVTRKKGREKLHFLNPIPILMIHDRWIGKYTREPAARLLALKKELESDHG